MRLLAVDPASNVIGLAYFDRPDHLVQTAIIRAPAGPDTSPSSWLEKVEFFEARIQDRSVLWAPDVIAMEDVVVWRNAASALTLGRSWGWLAHVLKCEYRKAEFIEINTATVRSALGLSSRADRKARQLAARAAFPMCASQDEADAAAVGMTAYRVIAKLRAAAGLAPV